MKLYYQFFNSWFMDCIARGCEGYGEFAIHHQTLRLYTADRRIVDRVDFLLRIWSHNGKAVVVNVVG